MDLLELIKSLPAYQDLLDSIRSNRIQSGLGLPRAARLAILAALYTDLNQPIVFVVNRADHAIALKDELAFWSPTAPRYLFSEPNPLFYEEGSWSNVIRFERIQALTALARYHLPYIEKPTLSPIIISSARALMTRTLPRRDFLKATYQLVIGRNYQSELLLRTWMRIGYRLVDTVLEPGQFCRRGGLLDIWPSTEPYPVRLEFFGNELETIRYFNPGSQRTIENIQAIVYSPAREFFLLGDGDNSGGSQYSEFHIPILHPNTSSLFDYLPNNSLIVFDDLGLVESAVLDIEEQALKLREDLETEGLITSDFPVPYFTWTELCDGSNYVPNLELGHSTAEELTDTRWGSNLLTQHFNQIGRFSGRLKVFMDYLMELTEKGCSITVVSRQAKRLEELWSEEMDNRPTSSIKFLESSLSSGWSIGNSYLFTDSEIFGWDRPQPRAIHQFSAEAPEMAYVDLDPGDWIVHVDYGIGRFSGLVKRTLDGIEREFLCVEFQNNDQVFVPIHQADRLTRYIGPGGTPAPLGLLGTQAWAETKRKVQEAVHEVALDLLELYAKRQVSRGYAFKKDTAWQGELESSFAYVETPDQLEALASIKGDMEAIRPMDRLLCGDVGYGKTEVALRAAFKAVMDDKQVAVLVPTTVLAQQHYETFKQRLSAFPVTVEMLSRFRTPREQTQILDSLAKGSVDIIIGTHRLISRDVRFKDLGLVIIDEEQRFGVTHKERFKHLRTEVDVLTLTATPIPRTLYMALTGVRDISNLNTPPEERLPIITHIGPYSPKLVRQAVMRELERGGQVFFVHNRVQTIHAMKMHLEKLIPEAQIAIGHGQMPEQELASVMHQFNSGDLDILLCSSIIESGLDIPNANTLIVDRGDAFGLAQLYQLRGRVGRGAARAYAYFFRHRKISPTPEGQERLEIIAENTKLGSGYSIAMRDLEMRGAGELLGTRQSGHIAAVGFHLYTRLLAGAVRSLRLSRNMADSMQDRSMVDMGIPVSVDLPLAASIPNEYVPDQALRLRLYRRLADLPDESSLDALQTEFIDRFGVLPEIVKNLFYQMRVKIRAEKAKLISVGSESGQIVLRYQPSQDGKPSSRLPDLGPAVRGGKNAYWCTFGKDPGWQEKLLEILGLLAKE